MWEEDADLLSIQKTTFNAQLPLCNDFRVCAVWLSVPTSEVWLVFYVLTLSLVSSIYRWIMPFYIISWENTFLHVATTEEYSDLWKHSDLARPHIQAFGGDRCLEQCLPQCLKSNDTHLLVTTAKHRSSKASLHFVGDVARTLTSDDLHFICLCFVATVQEEVLSKQFRTSCDNW